MGNSLNFPQWEKNCIFFVCFEISSFVWQWPSWLLYILIVSSVSPSSEWWADPRLALGNPGTTTCLLAHREWEGRLGLKSRWCEDPKPMPLPNVCQLPFVAMLDWLFGPLAKSSRARDWDGLHCKLGRDSWSVLPSCGVRHVGTFAKVSFARPLTASAP